MRKEIEYSIPFVDETGQPGKIDLTLSFVPNIAIRMYNDIIGVVRQVQKTWDEITYIDEENYGCVNTDNGWGFINREGYLMIPDDYETFLYPYFENGYCVAKKNGKYGMIDRKNHIIFPFI